MHPYDLFVDAGLVTRCHEAGVAVNVWTVDRPTDGGLLERVGELASHWEDALHSLKGVRNVIDIRNIGLMGAVELAPRDGAVGARGPDLWSAFVRTDPRDHRAVR